LKIKGQDLPAAPFGDSDSLVIGEWVVALGNPFGFLLEDNQPTVTVGVVSALHRSIRSTGEMIFRDMIQTDAAINPGNSGGPLIDLAGAVIGINTFILTAGGGSEGIGFARPINIIKKKMREFLKGSKLTPWLGLQVSRTDRGVKVSSIDSTGPAKKAGLEIGDIIIRFNNRRINGPVDWENGLASVVVGDTIHLEYLRNNKKLSTRLFVTAAPSVRGSTLNKFSIEVKGISPYLQQNLNLPVNKGVVIVKVDPVGLGARLGLEVGDIITSVNRRKIRKVDDLKILEKLNQISMVINRKGTRLRIYLGI
ncbi:MAG TPA: PDZ domain-containing protein, partial [bacterium (Candidatus Stahlbacteria)]|nr:PDZ domain-containing protein [Candidatus Stahlbacteria bacterium]